jgi:tripartite-type tricarboxylate transporter receptor subunit TctC
MLRRHILGLTAAGLATPSVLRAQGAAWPERPVRLVVPFRPGGSNDTIARLMQPKLQEILGQPVVIENRGGASGSIGAIEASRASPDGYTWILVQENEATNQTVMRLPYRVMQAFAPVSLLGTGPLALVAHQSTPWKNFRIWWPPRRRRRTRSATPPPASAASPTSPPRSCSSSAVSS